MSTAAGLDRATAEKELNRLINRALRSVPFVKLDKVDEITRERADHALSRASRGARFGAAGLFEAAVDKLESSCDLSPEEVLCFSAGAVLSAVHCSARSSAASVSC